MAVLKAKVAGSWVEIPGLASATPGGTSGQVQYNAAGAFGGASEVEIASGMLQLVGSPGFGATPAAGRVTIPMVQFGNCAFPFLVPAQGNPGILPPVGWMYRTTYGVTNNATAINVGWGTATINQGTATAAAMATTTAQQRQRRTENLVTVASTTAVASFQTSGEVTRATTAGSAVYGCLARFRWGPATGVTNTSQRGFAGFRNGSAPTDVQPSTLTDCIGMGWDAADANIQVMFNDNVSTCTKSDLGSAFPVPTVDRTDWYEMYIYAPPGVAEYSYLIINMTSGTAVSGVANTNIPTVGAQLYGAIQASVGGISSVVGVALGAMDFWYPN